MSAPRDTGSVFEILDATFARALPRWNRAMGALTPSRRVGMVALAERSADGRLDVAVLPHAGAIARLDAIRRGFGAAHADFVPPYALVVLHEAGRATPVTEKRDLVIPTPDVN